VVFAVVHRKRYQIMILVMSKCQPYLGELVTSGTENSPVVLQPADSVAVEFRGVTIRQNQRGLYWHLIWSNEV